MSADLDPELRGTPDQSSLIVRPAGLERFSGRKVLTKWELAFVVLGIPKWRQRRFTRMAADVASNGLVLSSYLSPLIFGSGGGPEEMVTKMQIGAVSTVFVSILAGTANAFLPRRG